MKAKPLTQDVAFHNIDSGRYRGRYVVRVIIRPGLLAPLIRRALKSTGLRTLIADGGLEVCLVKAAPTSAATSPVEQAGAAAAKKAGST
jgi:hypothetical protein